MNLNDLAANALQHQRSTPDLIADALRQAILHGVLEGGQSLRQDEIASKFGVSRIPVREALRQLEAEGLVKFHANRGATVTMLTPSEAEEIFEIRIPLETTALQFAIPYLSDADFQKADMILTATEQTTDAGRWAELDWDFHLTLYAPCQRPRLLNLIQNLHLNIDRYVRLQLAQTKDLGRSPQEHVQLLDACRHGDADTAIPLLQQHIADTGKQLVAYLHSRSRSKR